MAHGNSIVAMERSTRISDSYHGKMRIAGLCMALNGYGRMHWVVRLLTGLIALHSLPFGVAKGVQRAFDYSVLFTVYCMFEWREGDESIGWCLVGRLKT